MDIAPFIPNGDEGDRKLYGRKTKTDRIAEQVAKFVKSPANADWFLFGPVAKGYISYADLVNGTVNLYDVYMLNKIIEYQNVLEDEVRHRMREK